MYFIRSLMGEISYFSTFLNFRLIDVIIAMTFEEYFAGIRIYYINLYFYRVINCMSWDIAG